MSESNQNNQLQFCENKQCAVVNNPTENLPIPLCPEGRCPLINSSNPRLLPKNNLKNPLCTESNCASTGMPTVTSDYNMARQDSTSAFISFGIYILSAIVAISFIVSLIFTIVTAITKSKLLKTGLIWVVVNIVLFAFLILSLTFLTFFRSSIHGNLI